MTRSSRPLWPLLTAVLIGVPVLYMASFGPACWLVGERYMQPKTGWMLYRPLVRLIDYDRDQWERRSVGLAIQWWVELFDHGGGLGRMCKVDARQP